MKKHLKAITKVISMALVCALVFTTLMPATSYAKVRVATPRVTSAITTTNKATVKWPKVSNVTGYIVDATSLFEKGRRVNELSEANIETIL